MATIQSPHDGTGYYLEGYDELSESAGRNGYVHFSDATCSENPVRVITTSPQLFFTKTANIIDENNFIHQAGKATYFIEAGTAFTKTTSETTLYTYSSYEDSCNVKNIPANALITPIVELSQEVHDLKSTYSTITIEGYSTPN
jgi:hypothetical protein